MWLAAEQFVAWDAVRFAMRNGLCDGAWTLLLCSRQYNPWLTDECVGLQYDMHAYVYTCFILLCSTAAGAGQHTHVLVQHSSDGVQLLLLRQIYAPLLPTAVQIRQCHVWQGIVCLFLETSLFFWVSCFGLLLTQSRVCAAALHQLVQGVLRLSMM